MRYCRKDNQYHTVDAIQYTNQESLDLIREHTQKPISIGQYAIAVGFAVVIEDKEYFERRFRPDPVQMEMF